MKTYLLACLCLGMLHTTNAQDQLAVVTDYKLAKKVKISNADYRTSFENNLIAERAQRLRDIVADYNLNNTTIYKENEKSRYTVDFREGQNSVKATYDDQGNITTCKETYKNIRLPLTLSQKLIKEYPGYHIGTVVCKINYTAKTDIKKMQYKVELLKANDRKVVRLNL